MRQNRQPEPESAKLAADILGTTPELASAFMGHQAKVQALAQYLKQALGLPKALDTNELDRALDVLHATVNSLFGGELMDKSTPSKPGINTPHRVLGHADDIGKLTTTADSTFIELNFRELAKQFLEAKSERPHQPAMPELVESIKANKLAIFRELGTNDWKTLDQMVQKVLERSESDPLSTAEFRTARDQFRELATLSMVAVDPSATVSRGRAQTLGDWVGIYKEAKKAGTLDSADTAVMVAKAYILKQDLEPGVDPISYCVTRAAASRQQTTRSIARFQAMNAPAEIINEQKQNIEERSYLIAALQNNADRIRAELDPSR